MLTDTERERLTTLSATLGMGWTEWRQPRSGRLLGFTDENGDHWWLKDNDHSIPVIAYIWNPLVSLDQAVMVAEAVSLWTKYYLWPYDIGGQSAEWLYRVVRKDHTGNAIGDSDNPAEALLLACAEAGGWEWKDG